MNAAIDLSYSIGLPILQDNGEFEWPLYFGDTLIAFFANIPAAELAAQAWLARWTMPVDVDFATTGWTE